MFKDIEIIKRLYKDYTFHHIKKIILAILLSFFVAGSTSAIAYLLDPAIKKIFIEKDQTLTYLIPIFIVVAFATKGISLYIARVLMIIVGEEVNKCPKRYDEIFNICGHSIRRQSTHGKIHFKSYKRCLIIKYVNKHRCFKFI